MGRLTGMVRALRTRQSGRVVGFRRVRAMLGSLRRTFGRQAMREGRSAKMKVLQPLGGGHVHVGYGSNPIKTWSGVLEVGGIGGSGVILRKTETDRAIRLVLPDIQWVVDSTTGQEWHFG